MSFVRSPHSNPSGCYGVANDHRPAPELFHFLLRYQISTCLCGSPDRAVARVQSRRLAIHRLTPLHRVWFFIEKLWTTMLIDGLRVVLTEYFKVYLSTGHECMHMINWIRLVSTINYTSFVCEGIVSGIWTTSMTM